MSETEYEQMNISRVAADVKECLVRDADAREASVNDVLASILAQKYRIRFDGTGRKGSGAGVREGGAIVLRIPPALKQKIDLAVPREPRGQRTIVALVDRVLREHYGLVAVPA